ncbi:MAG TPA: pirin family protein [Bacteroidales bacterium]|nr:pirin family protein [Bacteroidales bacterium]
MNTTKYASDSRGKANYGWLKTRYSFSFAEYYDASRVRFGVLRVLNDDEVAGGEGFGMHPHDNMEIITIPLEGKLQHKDSMGNTSVIESGEIQVMSAGTGIMHSEFNPDPEIPVKLLQIWVFPDVKNHTPRYQQAKIDTEALKNRLHTIVSPETGNGTVWIHQNAFFSLGEAEFNQTWRYVLNDKNNGMYIFVIEGSAKIDEMQLHRRDAAGITDTSSVEIDVEGGTRLLLMEIPM